jgi:XPG I-region
VYGVATDDMDALTFGTPKLIRHLLAPGGANKLTIDEFDFRSVLEGMGLTHVRSRKREGHQSFDLIFCWTFN